MCFICCKQILEAFMPGYCSQKCYFKSMKVPVKEVWERDSRTCHICGEDVCLEDASRDHLIPRSHGGPTTFENVALAHKKCNSRRGTKPVAEVRRDRTRSSPGGRGSAVEAQATDAIPPINGQEDS